VTSDEPELENWQSAEETQNTGFLPIFPGLFPAVLPRPAIRFPFSLSPDKLAVSLLADARHSSLVTSVHQHRVAEHDFVLIGDGNDR
jgi:hypothetical protein